MHSQGLRLTLAGFYEYYCITYRRALGIAVPEDVVGLKESLLLLFLLKPCKIPLSLLLGVPSLSDCHLFRV